MAPLQSPSSGQIRRVRVHPGPLAGTVRVPGDKSLSHRAVLLAALADGGADVGGVVASGDVVATIEAVRRMGATIDLVAGPDGSLAGRIGGPLGEPDGVIDCGNSGTGMRLLAGVAAGIDGLTVLTGDDSLRRRPMDRVSAPLRSLGAVVDGRADGALPPLAIRGGRLHSGNWDSPVASAQVKSCVLLAGLVGGVEVSIRSPLPSRDHTERLLRGAGLEVTTTVDEDGETVRLRPGPVRFASAIEVPGDPSSAAFWYVAAALAGRAVTVEGVSVNPTRTGVLDVLADFGVDVARSRAVERCGEPVADVTVTGDGSLQGARVAGRRVVDAIDELPVLALAGALSVGGLDVRDAAELRAKESDRISVMARTFAALGMRLDERPDGYLVPGGQRPAGGTVDASGDHRIAMAACIAATVATGPVEVTGFESVATSYPTFLDDFAALGGSVDVLDPG